MKIAFLSPLFPYFTFRAALLKKGYVGREVKKKNEKMESNLLCGSRIYTRYV